MSISFSFVFLFPCGQDTSKQKEKNTEDTTRKGCRPKKLGRNTGVDQIEVDQDQHRRDADNGQDNGYDIKRYFYIHDDSFPAFGGEEEDGTHSFFTTCHYYITRSVFFQGHVLKEIYFFVGRKKQMLSIDSKVTQIVSEKKKAATVSFPKSSIDRCRNKSRCQEGIE